ncbi:MBL fold metallo-hydrolase [Amycolatopsis sp. NPDC005232]|uniref:MBL fold metallo-hydrolase n=1 Tax=Amycolatopsis sp. NPDC005232 TaxID=3157027 RepID=UPI0033A80BF2
MAVNRMSAEPQPGSADRNAWTLPATEEVATGVYRIPLPMPGDNLKAVNVYALEQPDGLTLIDGGWARAEARAALEIGVQTIGAQLTSIKRILVTHAHRDHYTLAVILRREFGMPIALGAGERASIEALTSTNANASFGSQMQLLRGAGAEKLARIVESQAVYVNPKTDGWEVPDEWLDGGTIEAGGSELKVVPTPGHTRGHLVFADLGRGLLFSGDHVLPHITPSIGLETVASPSPLTSFLASLALVRTLPDLRLLPAHGPVAASSHTRVDELVTHHDRRLAEIGEAVSTLGEHPALPIARQLGWTRHRRHFDELDVFNQMLAVGETIAHLDVLIRSGLVRERAEGELTLYSAVSS